MLHRVINYNYTHNNNNFCQLQQHCHTHTYVNFPSGPSREYTDSSNDRVLYSAKFSRHLYFMHWLLKTISLHNVRGMTAYRKPRL